jgi:organic hydroperoxide reductase OsmC/OhrA
MLTFVYLAQKAGFVVDAYEDHAVGTMTKSERGATAWVSHVALTPRIAWGGAKRPTEAEEEHLHHEAHEQCFIAQSVKTEITVARPS